ncbi:unnamed protein product [Effrenium voratum]|uniref:diacylglycerol O-acyltransferase n=1 Tax=Effrenium voratum TaxID=2562239 RepID=A0AA36IJZ7_9DINO|nr:unnamed protein product [Effrenium voratum]
MMAFGVTDLSHDVLVTPTRAQMNDIFEPDAAESRSATSSGLAKVLALFCAFLLPRTFAFISVAGVVACATLLQLVASCSKTGVMAVARPMTVAVPSMNTGQDESPTDGGSISRYPRGFWQMWALQFVGWLSVCTWSFYFSSVWAQILQAKPGTPDFDAAVQQGTQWLLYGSIVFLAAGSFLTQLSAPTGLLGGEMMSMCAAVTVMAATLAAVCLAHLSLQARYVSIVLVVLAMPISYQILANTPFAWIERQDGFDAKSRGKFTGIFNSSLAAAQATTAVLSGPLTAAFGGQLWSAYAAVVVVDIALLVFLTLGYLCRRLERRKFSSSVTGAHCMLPNGKRRPATELQKIAAQLAVAIPELGWSVCEALFIPLLIELEVPAALLSIGWAISPLFGLFLQGYVGRQSDIHGRTPFIVFFGAMSVVGLTVSPLMPLLSSKAAAGMLAMVTFGVADLSRALRWKEQMLEVATAVLSGPLTAACGGQLWSAYAAVVVVDVAILAFLTLAWCKKSGFRTMAGTWGSLRSLGLSAAALAAQLPWWPLSRRRLTLSLLAGYLLSFLNGDERRPGSRRSLFLLAAVQRFWNAVLPFFFNVDCKVEDIEELRACDQCVVAVHPHGVLSFGHYLLISGFHPDLEKALPARRRCALSAGVIFKLPVVREIALGMGCVDAHRDIAERCLCGGLSLSVVPGGEREQLLAQRGQVEKLVLKHRQGFVRLALQHGVPVVPVYVFGEAQLYKQSQLLFGLRSWVQRKLGIALVMPYGPWGLPFLKFPDPIRMVVGKPVHMPRTLHPTSADLEQNHARYVQALCDLFERNKAASGYGSHVLEIV